MSVPEANSSLPLQCHLRCLKQVLWEREWASCRMLGVWGSAETAENAERLQGREGWKAGLREDPAASWRRLRAGGCRWQLTEMKSFSLCPCVTYLGEPSLGFPGGQRPSIPASRSSRCWFTEDSGPWGQEASCVCWDGRREPLPQRGPAPSLREPTRRREGVLG